MNLDKSEFKMQLARNWGKKFEDFEENAKIIIYRLEGSAASLKKAAQALDESRSFYQKQVDDEIITMAECKLAMRVIDRCIGSLDNLAETDKINRLVKQGELLGYKKTLDFMEKEHTEEKKRVEGVLRAIESGEPDLRLVGKDTKSASDDIAKRRAEAKVEKEEQKPKTEKEIVNETIKTAAQTAAKKKTNKKKL